LCFSYRRAEDGSSASRWARQHWIVEATKAYFPTHVHLTEPISHGPYIFGMHPHGVFGVSYLGFLGTSGFQSFPGVEAFVGVALALLRAPIVRDLFLSWGFVDASQRVMRALLHQGKSLCIFLGSESEAFEFSKDGDIVLFLESRRGFIRLAIEQGVSIVPTFCFGLNDVYTQVHFQVWALNLKCAGEVVSCWAEKLVDAQTPRPTPALLGAFPVHAVRLR